jgi:hypothetical protein
MVADVRWAPAHPDSAVVVFASEEVAGKDNFEMLCFSSMRRQTPNRQVYSCYYLLHHAAQPHPPLPLYFSIVCPQRLAPHLLLSCRHSSVASNSRLRIVKSLRFLLIIALFLPQGVQCSDSPASLSLSFNLCICKAFFQSRFRCALTVTCCWSLWYRCRRS